MIYNPQDTAGKLPIGPLLFTVPYAKWSHYDDAIDYYEETQRTVRADGGVYQMGAPSSPTARVSPAASTPTTVATSIEQMGSFRGRYSRPPAGRLRAPSAAKVPSSSPGMSSASKPWSTGSATSFQRRPFSSVHSASASRYSRPPTRSGDCARCFTPTGVKIHEEDHEIRETG